VDDAIKWAKRVDTKGLIATPLVGQAMVNGMRNKVAAAWFRAALPRGTDPTAYTDRALLAFKNGARFPLASVFQSMMRDVSALEGLKTNHDAVLLWGSADRSHRHSDPRAAMATLPNASFQELTQCGHFPDLEQPDQYAAAIRSLAR
jgi:pimeloyl-ACP methyl ester carboxylesterase